MTGGGGLAGGNRGLLGRRRPGRRGFLVGAGGLVAPSGGGPTVGVDGGRAGR